MSRLYIGRLASRTRERDLEDAFGKYGKIRAIDLKYGFAFVVREYEWQDCSFLLTFEKEYSDSRDAEDAIRGLDGREFDGMKRKPKKKPKLIPFRCSHSSRACSWWSFT